VGLALEKPPPAFGQARGADPIPSPTDRRLLEDLIAAGWRFFLENAHPQTGLVRDRSATTGVDPRPVASTAASGFGLTALCIADHHRLLPHREARTRATRSLRFLAQQLPHEHGFPYHFIHWSSGKRFWASEASSIDTALMLAGVQAVALHFGGRELRELARAIEDRIEWDWLLNDRGLLRHGFRPENGLLAGSWESYCEHMLLYLFATGARRHAIPAGSWDRWERPIHEYQGRRYIGSDGPLFVHQYSHAWVDFRGVRDAYANYFENSRVATEVHRQFCLGLRGRFPKYGEDLWGITASDSAQGYQAWGGPPEMGVLDGSVVPCAAAGSMAFAPGPCLQTLRHQREHYGEQVWGRYGFVDAFNPHTGWVNPDVIAIDVGISVLMSENLLSGWVWDLMRQSSTVRAGMARVGFRREPAAPRGLGSPA
jgi:hypothetical protein